MLTSHAPVLNPATLEEALKARAEAPDAWPLAGGTDVMVYLEAEAIDPPQFLNLWRLDALRRIELGPDGLWLGALATWTDLARDVGVQAMAPTLVEAARTVGAAQIQNRGTLGGNIANASPAGDSLPVLMSLDAEVELQSAARGARLVPFADFYKGYKQTEMQPDELITRVRLPRPKPGDNVHFRKVGTRLAQAISKVIFGGRLCFVDGVVSEARICFGSVAAVPVRCPTVEAALVGQPVSLDAAELITADITPIDDVRSTAAYRLSVARRVLRSWLASLS